MASQVALVLKNPPVNAGDVRDEGLIPGLGGFPWRRTWQPTPVFFPGESHGQKSLVGYSPWGRKESDTAEVTWHACMLSDHICASTLLADGETKAQRWEGLAQRHVGQ